MAEGSIGFRVYRVYRVLGLISPRKVPFSRGL